MATIVEADVIVSVLLSRGPDGTQRAQVSATSVDSAGTPIRQLNDVDIYPTLDANGQNTVTNVIDFVRAKAKAFWQIP